MENVDNDRKSGFDKLCRKKVGKRICDDRSGGELFETDWEVFVARLDKNTGKYVSLTFCCEDAVA